MIEEFDQTVHHPVRLGVLTILGSVERATFAYLQPKGVAEVNFPSTFTNEFLPK